MWKIFAVFGAGPKGFESFSDRLSSRTTVFIMLALAIVIAIRVLIKAPIACHPPAQFNERQAEFMNEKCWATTYYYNSLSSRHQAAGHQGVPFLLAFLAFFFYLPKLFWNFGCSYSGLLSTHHIESAALEVTSDRENSSQAVSYMARCLGQRLVDLQSSWKTATVAQRFRILLCCNASSTFYFFAKVLYAINVIGQLHFFDVFLHGSGGLSRFLAPSNAPRTWQGSWTLPDTFSCDFETRVPGIETKHTVQCSLPLNLWYDSMLNLLWAWLFFVTLVTLFSLILFVVSQLNYYYQERYCRVRILAMGKANDAQFHQIARFVKDFMTRDTWYFIKQVSSVSGDRTATELVVGLWQYYTEHEENTGTTTPFDEENKFDKPNK